jgi:hypothetical protein
VDQEFIPMRQLFTLSFLSVERRGCIVIASCRRLRFALFPPLSIIAVDLVTNKSFDLWFPFLQCIEMSVSHEPPVIGRGRGRGIEDDDQTIVSTRKSDEEKRCKTE